MASLVQLIDYWSFCVLLFYDESKVGVTRFNMDGSGSNYSVSTSNSPMMNRDVHQPFNQGELRTHHFIFCYNYFTFNQHWNISEHICIVRKVSHLCSTEWINDWNLCIFMHTRVVWSSQTLDNKITLCQRSVKKILVSLLLLLFRCHRTAKWCFAAIYVNMKNWLFETTEQIKDYYHHKKCAPKLIFIIPDALKSSNIPRICLST